MTGPVKIGNVLLNPRHHSFSSRLRQSTRSLWPILSLVVALTATSSCTSRVTEADLPVQLVNNLLFVPVRVGSSQVLSFILDDRDRRHVGTGDHVERSSARVEGAGQEVRLDAQTRR